MPGVVQLFDVVALSFSCVLHSSLHHVHCIMSSCHHVFSFLTQLNKFYGSSIHLNRGKDDFSL